MSNNYFHFWPRCDLPNEATGSKSGAAHHYVLVIYFPKEIGLKPRLKPTLVNWRKILKEQGDISNGSLCESTAASLRRYAVVAKLSKKPEESKLPIQIVKPLFLRQYEKWMLKSGKASQKKDGSDAPASLTTISIYTRNIRKIWNEAKETKIVLPDNYPFGKGGYKIPAVVNKKKALDFDVLAEIFNYKCKEGSSRQKWRDLWLFIYMGNGLNTMDLCNIKNRNLDYTSGKIEFFRDKTMETKREDMALIQIYLTPELMAIIEKWRNLDRDPDAYLFPFLPKDVTPLTEKKLVNQVTKNINDHMKRISKELKLDIEINTYQARHSFATTLLRSEAPLAFISQSLGHSSISTTQKYLGSFEIEQTKKYMSALIPKPKKENEEN